MAREWRSSSAYVTAAPMRSVNPEMGALVLTEAFVVTVIGGIGWSGVMLGLGRALGETIAVALLLPGVPTVSVKILQNGGATVSAFIANRAGSDSFTTSGLMAAGLVLFLITSFWHLVTAVWLVIFVAVFVA